MTARVSVVMGSASDYATLRAAEGMLRSLEIPHDVAVVSAHRTPERMVSFAKTAAERGVRVIIAGAGGAAHLPGMIASLTALPVLGVPIPSGQLRGVDSLLSIVQMPAGVPTATFAIGEAGAVNAALFAARILAADDADLAERLERHRREMAETALAADAQVRAESRDADAGARGRPS